MDISQLSLDQRLQKVTSRLFGINAPAFQKALVDNAEIVALDGGDILFQQGEESDHMYILISGRLHAAVYKNGIREVVGEIGFGETVGEMSLLTGEPRSAQVYAIRDSILLDISKSNFEQLAQDYPQALLNITKLVIRRLQRSNISGTPQASFDNFTFLNLSADPDLIKNFVPKLFIGLQQIGKTCIINESIVAAHFNTTLETMDFHKSNHLLTSWITELEQNHDYLIMLASESNEPWTKRCLRQADKVVLIGTPQELRNLHPIESKMLIGDTPISTADQELLILHPKGDLPRGTKEILGIRQVKQHFHLEQGNDRHIERYVRFMTNTANGLVLSGGGAKGIAHVGIIRALKEAHIPIDYLGGTSIGSIMAGFVAMGYDADKLSDEPRSAFISNPTPPREFNWVPVFGLTSGRKLDGLLEHFFGDMEIEDLWIPFYCVSSNLTKAKMEIHETGELRKAIRASISLPGIFTPALHNNSLLVDGGIFNNFPVDVMSEKSVGNIIAVSLDSEIEDDIEFDQFPNRASYLWNKLLGRKKEQLKRIPNLMHTLVLSTLANSNAHARSLHSEIDLLFKPEVSGFGLMDWKSFDQIADEGYRHAQSVIEESKIIAQFQKVSIQ